jgi:hypothetical protein
LEEHSGDGNSDGYWKNILVMAAVMAIGRTLLMPAVNG